MTTGGLQHAHQDLLDALRRAPVRRADGVPLYIQAASVLERSLHTHGATPGQLLPGENELARSLGVSRPTLRQAVRHLADRGLVYTQRGVGTFVSPQTLTRTLQMSSLFDDLEARDLSPSSRVLALRTTEADDLVATELGLPPRTPLLLVERLRLAERRPVALITNLLSLPTDGTLTGEELSTDGLYHLLRRKFGIELVTGVQKVSARLATAREARLLDLEEPAALLSAHRTSFDAAGHGVEVSITLYTEATEISSPLVSR